MARNLGKMEIKDIALKKGINEDTLQCSTPQSKSHFEILMSAIFMVFVIAIAFATYISTHSVTISQSYESNTFLHNISTLLTPIFVHLIILNVVIIVILIFTKRLFWLIIPCLAIAINWHIIPNIIQLRSTPNTENLTNTLTLQSYNVHRFTYKSFENTVDNILLSVAKNKVDILCLQEYTIYKDEANYLDHTTIDERVKKFNNLSEDKVPIKNTHKSSLSKTFPYACFSDKDKKTGIALFSLYPILYNETHKVPNSNQEALVADLEINGAIIRVITVHMQTTSISQHHNETSILTDGFSIAETSYKLDALSTLMQAFIKSSSIRREQADVIYNLIKKSPHPVIVCGDFNDTPNSYSYHKFDQVLNDAFKTVGSGYASSYIQPVQLLRIDYIFHSKNINPMQFYYKSYPWSDHSAAFFKFKIPPL